MAGPKQKFFGSLSLDEIGKAVKGAPSKYNEHEKYGKQLKITAAQWEDDGISIQVYDSESKEVFKIGSLKVSQFDKSTSETPAAPVVAAAVSDLPF